MKAAYTNTLPFSLNEYGIAVCALLDIRPLGPEPTVAEAALQHAVQNVIQTLAFFRCIVQKKSQRRYF